MLALGFFRGESCWYVCSEVPREMTLLLLFSLISSRLHTSRLCSSLGWVTEVGPACIASEDGKLMARAALPSLLGELSLPEELPPGSEHAGKAGGMMLSKAKLFFLPFPCGYSQVVPLSCYGVQSSSSAVCVWIVV